jgi:predicted metallopeptidase
MEHVNLERVSCIRSIGSGARGTIARCHALPKIMQLSMHCEPFYIIEVLSEEFDRMNQEDQTRVLIHELLHVPKAFGGGFKHHDYVNDRMVERFYRQFVKEKNQEGQEEDFREKLKKAARDVFKR